MKRIPPLAPALAWTAVIVVLCVLPGNDLPDIAILGIDKMVHIAMFALFGVLWLRIRMPPTVSVGVAVVLGGIAFGIGTEFLQGWLGWGRVMDPFDAIANAIGVTTAVGAKLLLARRKKES